MSDYSLLCAAVSALHRLVSLPGNTTVMRICQQRWCIERLVKLSTSNSIEQVEQLARQIWQRSQTNKGLQTNQNGLSCWEEGLDTFEICKDCVPVAVIYEAIGVLKSIAGNPAGRLALADHESTLLKACLSAAFLDSNLGEDKQFNIHNLRALGKIISIVVLDSRQLGMISKVLLLTGKLRQK